MRLRSLFFYVCIFAGVAALAISAAAQSQGAAKPAQPAPKPAATQPAPKPAQGAAAAKPAQAGSQQIHGTLIQVMRGVLLPASNVFFYAQAEDPAKVEPDDPAATSPNPLKLPKPEYGGWVAVENASITMAEAANLISMPGRRCSNGRPVPIDNADWKQFTQELRDAGMAAFKAAQSKNQDRVLEEAEKVTVACGHCHDVYREKDGKGGLPARCTK
jgi:hypothetical protein